MSDTSTSSNSPTSPISPGAPGSPPTSPVDAPTTTLRAFDRDGFAHLLEGYRNGGYIDVLVQELVDQGYGRVDYDSIAMAFHRCDLELSPDRALDEAEKVLVAEAAANMVPPFLRFAPSAIRFIDRDGEGNMVVLQDPERRRDAFKARFGQLKIHDAKHQPLGLKAAVFIVKEFRRGVHLEFILTDLSNRGYVSPSLNFIDEILAANEMSREDARREVMGEFDAYEGRVWGDIIIPDELLVERKPFDKAGVIYFVEQYRSSHSMEDILYDLQDFSYEVPTFAVLEKILKANGLSIEDEDDLGPNGFMAHEGRVWDKVVVPAGIFGEPVPFDREAAILIVERFRAQKPSEIIMSELKKLNYILPSWEIFSKVLEANDMVLRDQFTPGPNGKGFAGYDGRLWGRIVVPEGIFDKEA